MDELELIRSDLRRSYHGPAWHGPALLEALADLNVSEAVRHPIAGAHSAAELLLHVLAWTEEVTSRILGGEATLPERGDWPHVRAMDEAAWDSVRHDLETAARKLDRALAGFPAERLLERVGGSDHDPPLGTGVRFEVMLRGLAQHNAYHGGQIALLKHAVRPRVPGEQPPGFLRA